MVEQSTYYFYNPLTQTFSSPAQKVNVAQPEAEETVVQEEAPKSNLAYKGEAYFNRLADTADLRASRARQEGKVAKSVMYDLASTGTSAVSRGFKFAGELPDTAGSTTALLTGVGFVNLARNKPFYTPIYDNKKLISTERIETPAQRLASSKGAGRVIGDVATYYLAGKGLDKLSTMKAPNVQKVTDTFRRLDKRGSLGRSQNLGGSQKLVTIQKPKIIYEIKSFEPFKPPSSQTSSVSRLKGLRQKSVLKTNLKPSFKLKPTVPQEAVSSFSSLASKAVALTSLGSRALQSSVQSQAVSTTSATSQAQDLKQSTLSRTMEDTKTSTGNDTIKPQLPKLPVVPIPSFKISGGTGTSFSFKSNIRLKQPRAYTPSLAGIVTKTKRKKKKKFYTGLEIRGI